MLTSDIQTCIGVGVGGVLYYTVHIRGEGVSIVVTVLGEMTTSAL